MSKFVKENKKIIGIVGGAVVVAGVAIGVICATSNLEEKKPSEDKTVVATSTVEKEEKENTKEVYKKEESALEKAQKEIKDSINQDYFATEDGLEVHSKKDNDSKVIKTLKYNESILVHGKTEENCYIVDVDGETEYISNEKDPLSAFNIEDKKKADEEAQQLYQYLVSHTRSYYGAQSGTFAGILNSVANGSMSTLDAINRINSMTWQEDAHSTATINRIKYKLVDVKPFIYTLKVIL